MVRFLLARLAVLIPTFLGRHLRRLHPDPPGPGRSDPADGRRARHDARSATPQLMAQYGFDRPLVAAVSGASSATCCRATSAARSSPASRSWRSSSPCSRPRSSCRVVAMLLALSIGLPAGILAAVKRGSILDHTVMGVSLTGFSMPIFWWGAAADHPVLRHPAMDAGLGPDLAASTSSSRSPASC